MTHAVIDAPGVSVMTVGLGLFAFGHVILVHVLVSTYVSVYVLPVFLTENERESKAPSVATVSPVNPGVTQTGLDPGGQTQSGRMPPPLLIGIDCAARRSMSWGAAEAATSTTAVMSNRRATTASSGKWLPNH